MDLEHAYQNNDTIMLEQFVAEWKAHSNKIHKKMEPHQKDELLQDLLPQINFGWARSNRPQPHALQFNFPLYESSLLTDSFISSYARQNYHRINNLIREGEAKKEVVSFAKYVYTKEQNFLIADTIYQNKIRAFLGPYNRDRREEYKKRADFIENAVIMVEAWDKNTPFLQKKVPVVHEYPHLLRIVVNDKHNLAIISYFRSDVDLIEVKAEKIKGEWQTTREQIMYWSRD